MCGILALINGYLATTGKIETTRAPWEWGLGESGLAAPETGALRQGPLPPSLTHYSSPRN